MVGYAVGEMMSQPRTGRDEQLLEERDSEGEGGAHWHSSTPQHCYEVVTAWLHPK